MGMGMLVQHSVRDLDWDVGADGRPPPMLKLPIMSI
jgi:hypothetical protein